jgi:hypothetical protein
MPSWKPLQAAGDRGVAVKGPRYVDVAGKGRVNDYWSVPLAPGVVRWWSGTRKRRSGKDAKIPPIQRTCSPRPAATGGGRAAMSSTFVNSRSSGQIRVLPPFSLLLLLSCALDSGPWPWRRSRADHSVSAPIGTTVTPSLALPGIAAGTSLAGVVIGPPFASYARRDSHSAATQKAPLARIRPPSGRPLPAPR